MAKMIPQDITHLPVNTTHGEKALYRIIKKHTPDDWVCYVLQRLSVGTTPDFLLIGPDLGVLVLEEKNVSINMIKNLTTETWTVVRDGIPQEETHPLRQARGYVEKAAQAMKKVKRLTDKSRRLKFVFGHGVILSSIRKDEIKQGTITFTKPPIDTFEPLRVICSDELPSNRQNESDFAKRLKQMTKQFKFDPLNDGDIQSIRGVLFPEIRARVLADEMSDRNAILTSLTIEQEQMARGIGKNDKVPHRQLNGVAGSGKTIILRTRASDIAKANQDWKILVTFFTRSLKNYIGANLPENIDVMTVGQSIYRQWQQHNLDMAAFDVTSEKNWSTMVQQLREKGLSQGIYQAIFLDEYQDLEPSQADYLRHLLSEKTNCAFFCGDPAQNIFGKKPLRWIDHGFKFKGRTSNINLSCNFRNTHEIFEFAWDFIKDDFASKNAENVQSEALSNPYANIEIKRRGPKPILRKYASDEEEREAVCREIRRIVIDEKVPPRMISILHPNATQRYAERIEPYISYLEGNKIPTYWLSKNDSNKINYDPRDNFVTVSTPESGKGLEWDIVFMPSIERYQTDDPNYLRFVAAIRAVNILYPSACGDYR